MNKKGFTLVELLAVIAIIGIIAVIGTIAVTRVIGNSEKETIINEGQNLGAAAKYAYETDNRTGTICYSLQELYDKGYYSKGNTEGYSGSVLIKEEAGKKTVTFWITDGKYYIENGTTNSENEVKKSSSQTINLCNNETSGETTSIELVNPTGSPIEVKIATGSTPTAQPISSHCKTCETCTATTEGYKQLPLLGDADGDGVYTDNDSDLVKKQVLNPNSSFGTIAVQGGYDGGCSVDNVQTCLSNPNKRSLDASEAANILQAALFYESGDPNYASFRRMFGDINLNQHIDDEDLAAIQDMINGNYSNYYRNTTPQNGKFLKIFLADINMDGTIDNKDLNIAKKFKIDSCSNYTLYKLGDVTKDGIFAADDAAWMLQFYLNEVTYTDTDGTLKINYDYEARKITLGDVTEDGIVEADDTVRFMPCVLNSSCGYFNRHYVGDVNLDGKVNKTDYTQLQSILSTKGNGIDASNGKIATKVDVNIDGDFNQADVDYLKGYLQCNGLF